jgi:hypothetical protein
VVAILDPEALALLAVVKNLKGPSRDIFALL